MVPSSTSEVGTVFFSDWPWQSKRETKAGAKAAWLQIQWVSVDGGAAGMNGACVAVSTLWQDKHMRGRE